MLYPLGQVLWWDYGTPLSIVLVYILRLTRHGINYVVMHDYFSNRTSKSFFASQAKKLRVRKLQDTCRPMPQTIKCERSLKCI